MKRHWQITTCATALLTFTNMVALAQYSANPIHGQQLRVHQRGLSIQQYQQVNMNPRQYARTYFQQNEPAFKQPNQWIKNYAGRFHPDFVLDEDTRKASRSTPNDNDGTCGFGSSSRGYPYVVTGGHAIQFDSSKRVQDAAHVEIKIGH